MADKQIYPMISEKSWWQLRNQFKKTIPSVVNVSYLKSLLSLNSDQSARNILAPLRQMGIIDADGKPQPRATDWRSDAKYPDVCSAIIAEIYPQELLDLFPDTQVDNATAKSWFMDTCSLGDNAAGKITSTFSIVKIGAKPARAHGRAPRAHSDLRPYHRFTTFGESPDMPEPIRDRMGSFFCRTRPLPATPLLSDGMFGTGARARVRVHPEARLAAMENPGGRVPSQTIPFEGFPQPRDRFAP